MTAKRARFAYYRCANGFLGVTNESPKGMKDVLFIGRGPLPSHGIESVCEQGYAPSQLQKLERVEADRVPDDWFAAIGYEQRAPETPAESPDRIPERTWSRRDRQALQSLIGLAISFAIAWYLVIHVLQ